MKTTCPPCSGDCNQSRACPAPTREQLKPLPILDMSGREALFYAAVLVAAIAGFALYPWSVA
jgi:hypothetical protein